jgi:hypothetical protein
MSFDTLTVGLPPFMVTSDTRMIRARASIRQGSAGRRASVDGPLLDGVRLGTMGKRRKNPAAVALARLGASKGGKARAAKLSPERRREIARKAIMARWKKAKRRSER